LLMYADDLALYANDIETLQSALNALKYWSEASGLSVNSDKTKAMKIRRGGRLSTTDKLFYGSERIEFVNCYTYLGLTIPFNCKNFALHVKERCSRALRATYALRDTRVLSVQTALTLFDLKIKPI